MSFDYDKKEYPPENNTETENNEEEKREDQLSEEEPEETTEQFHKRNWVFPNEQEFSQDMECESKGLKCQLNTDLDSHKKISNWRQKINPVPNLEAARKKEHKYGAKSSGKAKETLKATWYVASYFNF